MKSWPVWITVYVIVLLGVSLGVAVLTPLDQNRWLHFAYNTVVAILTAVVSALIMLFWPTSRPKPLPPEERTAALADLPHSQPDLPAQPAATLSGPRPNSLLTLSNNLFTLSKHLEGAEQWIRHASGLTSTDRAIAVTNLTVAKAQLNAIRRDIDSWPFQVGQAAARPTQLSLNQRSEKPING